MDKKTADNIEFFITQEGEKVKLDIPSQGMLGLVAYGDIGLRAWRKVRQEEKDRKLAAENPKQLFIKGEETDG